MEQLENIGGIAAAVLFFGMIFGVYGFVFYMAFLGDEPEVDKKKARGAFALFTGGAGILIFGIWSESSNASWIKVAFLLSFFLTAGGSYYAISQEDECISPPHYDERD